MAFIYKITNDVNGKVYIGKTLHNVEKRWKEHIKDSKREHTENRPLYRAMNKYGIEHFRIETLEECVDEIAEEREVFWIKEYNSFGKNGYNATIGGDGKPFIDYNVVGVLWILGYCAKEICKITGYDTHSITKVLRYYGIGHKYIAIRSAQKFRATSVDMYAKDGKFLRSFASEADAMRFLGKRSSTGHISCVCNGKRKTAYGYVWKYHSI